jgi:hypothetical protein
MALKRGEKRNAISADGWVPELCGDLPSTDSDSHERQKYSTTGRTEWLRSDADNRRCGGRNAAASLAENDPPNAR